MTSTKQLFIVAAVAAAAVLSATSVLAQEMLPEQSRALDYHGTATRAQVIAQTLAAGPAARGEVDSLNQAGIPQMTSVLSRAAVKAETLRAIRAHEIINAGETYTVLPSRAERVAGNLR